MHLFIYLFLTLEHNHQERKDFNDVLKCIVIDEN